MFSQFLSLSLNQSFLLSKYNNKPSNDFCQKLEKEDAIYED